MYKIAYEDGSSFIGGLPEASKWNDIEDKPIKKLEYSIGNRAIIMEDYDGYNHLVEYALLSTKGKFLTKIILMGSEGNNVTSIIFNLKKHSIERQNAKLGYEYNGKITTGWKLGILNKTPDFKLYTLN